MKRNLQVVASLAMVIVLLSGIAWGQSKKRKRVPKPRSRQEVTTMGAGSDHDPNWRRNQQTGALEATSDKNPNESYTSPLDSLKDTKAAGATQVPTTTEAEKSNEMRACDCPSEHLRLAAKSGEPSGTFWFKGKLYHTSNFQGNCKDTGEKVASSNLNDLAGTWLIVNKNEDGESNHTYSFVPDGSGNYLFQTQLGPDDPECTAFMKTGSNTYTQKCKYVEEQDGCASSTWVIQIQNGILTGADTRYGTNCIHNTWRGHRISSGYRIRR